MKTLTTAHVDPRELRGKASHYRSLAANAEDGQAEAALLQIAADFDHEAEEIEARPASESS